MPPLEAIAEARRQGGFAWISLTRPAVDDLAALSDPLGLHPIAVRESVRGHQRGKLELFGDSVYLVLQPATYDDAAETVECSEVDIFAGKDFIVSVIDDGFVDAGAVRDELERHPELLARGTAAVVWAVFEAVVTGYAPVLSGVENDIDEIEEQLFTEAPEVSQRVFSLQRDVIDLHHATISLADMADRLQAHVQSRIGQDVPAFRELSELSRQVTDRVDAFRTTLASALAVHSTMVEQRNNEEMRRMTEQGLQQNDQVKKISSWAAIGLAPTVITGVYGMNFRYMPELEWPWGYAFALGLMAAVSVTLYVVFKRNDWL